jgi:hypothetical protein
MSRHRRRRKRCKFCGELFWPNPRIGKKQYSCSKPECQQKRQRLNCKQWHEANPTADSEKHLVKRLHQGREGAKSSDPREALHWAVARESIGSETLVVVEEIVRLARLNLREEIMTELAVFKAKIVQQLPFKWRDSMDRRPGLS